MADSNLSGEPAELSVVRVWIDVQLPPALAGWLRDEFSVAASHLEDLGLTRADDTPVFHAARAAAADIIVTKDEDFACLVDRFGPPPRILWLRCGNVKNAELRQILRTSWPEAARLLTAGETLVEIGHRSL